MEASKEDIEIITVGDFNLNSPSLWSAIQPEGIPRPNPSFNGQSVHKQNITKWIYCSQLIPNKEQR